MDTLSHVSQEVFAIGYGYDSFKGEPRNTIPVTSSAPQSKHACTFAICSDTESLYKSIGLSASLAGSVDLIEDFFGKISYAKTLKVTTYSVHMVVRAFRSTLTSLETWEGYPIYPSNIDDAVRFFHEYGDSFVSQIHKGGEFIATYSFFCRSSSDQTSLSSKLTVLFASDDGEVVDGDFQAKLETATASFEFSSEVKMYLSGYDGDRLPEIQEIITFASTLPPPNSPVTLNFETTGWEYAPSFPTQYFTNIIRNRTTLLDHIPGTKTSLGDLAIQLTHLLKECGHIQYILSAYGVKLPQEKAAQFEQDKTDITTDLTYLHTLIGYIEEDPNIEVDIPILPTLAWGEPWINDKYNRPSFINVLWGGFGGTPFIDIVPQDITIGKRIYKMRMENEYREDGKTPIDILTTTYLSMDLDESQAIQTLIHGIHSKNRTYDTGEVILDKEGDRAKYILCYTEVVGELKIDLVTYIRIDFTTNTIACPPVEPDSGKKHEITLLENQALVGFGGRSARNIDQIICKIIQFNEIIWSERPKSEEMQGYRYPGIVSKQSN